MKRKMHQEQKLFIKKSQIPNAGKGLWTSEPIAKGDIVCEYEGEKITWKECEERNSKLKGRGNYYFYISEKNCVDAHHTTEAFGRYANDAAGLGRVAKLRNNCIYEVRKGVPYIVATRNIKAGEEILVSYGRSYWNVMKKELN